MSNPKILLFDIETAPNIGYVWSIWNELRSMDFIMEHWYILCWSAKWLGEKHVMSSGICSNSMNDKKVVSQLWELIDEADIVIAHNGKKFDCRRINTRFIAHGMKPPSPVKVIDTLTEARRVFQFTSNRLNDLGVFLGVGKKIKTGGFELWKKCMNGDKKAWYRMMRYCAGDVRLLEKVYLKIRPYIKQQNVGVYLDRDCCDKCGSKKIQYRGYAVTGACKYRRFQCQDCGSWGRNNKNLSDTKTRGLS